MRYAAGAALPGLEPAFTSQPRLAWDAATRCLRGEAAWLGQPVCSLSHWLPKAFLGTGCSGSWLRQKGAANLVLPFSACAAGEGVGQEGPGSMPASRGKEWGRCLRVRAGLHLLPGFSEVPTTGNGISASLK